MLENVESEEVYSSNGNVDNLVVINKGDTVSIDGIVLSYADLKHRLADSVRYSELKGGVL